jgi:hypothetical protein
MTNVTRMESDPVISAGQDVATCPGRHQLDKTREGSPGITRTATRYTSVSACSG